MADERVDPSGNTEAFQAFVRQPDNEPQADGKDRRWVAIGAVAVIIVVAAILVIALR